MQEFAGRTAVVTGGASGIGLAIATRLAREGTNIVLADIEQGALDTAVKAIEGLGVACLGVRTDVTEQESVDALAAAATERFGNVHIVVNNAGVGQKGYSWELSIDDWRWVVGVCFWGVVHGIRSFVPGMIAHGEPGHIVNTSSMVGLGNTPSGGPYQSAKQAVVAATETLAFELAEVAPQLKVSVLCPGYVDTNIRDSRRNRQDKFGGPQAPPAPAGVPAVAQPKTAVRRSADDIAELAFDAIRNEQFYAFADWEIWRPIVARRFDAILDRKPPVPVKLP
jgi:NAD(P)-dependent dehydrogenase (short-subunit alcohol dehydrogenase family)